MKYFFLVLFFCSFSANAAPTSKKLLALRLWEAIEERESSSYKALDQIRNNMSDSDLKKKLSNPDEFKKIQKLIRNNFIDQVSKDFNRKEIMSLIKIFKNPALSKMHVFNIDF
jgi:hypothetical protein